MEKVCFENSWFSYWQEEKKDLTAEEKLAEKIRLKKIQEQGDLSLAIARCPAIIQLTQTASRSW